jgi:hypothetical protein
LYKARGRRVKAGQMQRPAVSEVKVDVNKVRKGTMKSRCPIGPSAQAGQTPAPSPGKPGPNSLAVTVPADISPHSSASLPRFLALQKSDAAAEYSRDHGVLLFQRVSSAWRAFHLSPQGSLCVACSQAPQHCLWFKGLGLHGVSPPVSPCPDPSVYFRLSLFTSLGDDTPPLSDI